MNMVIHTLDLVRWPSGTPMKSSVYHTFFLSLSLMLLCEMTAEVLHPRAWSSSERSRCHLLSKGGRTETEELKSIGVDNWCVLLENDFALVEDIEKNNSLICNVLVVWLKTVILNPSRLWVLPELIKQQNKQKNRRKLNKTPIVVQRANLEKEKREQMLHPHTIGHCTIIML